MARRLGPVLASPLLLCAVAASAPAAPYRTELATPGTRQDVGLTGGIDPRAVFATTESLTGDDRDGGQADLYRRVHGRYVLVSKPTGVPDPGTPVTAVGLGRTDKGGPRVLFETSGRYAAEDQDSARVDVYERSAGVTRLISGYGSDPDTGDAHFVTLGGTDEFPTYFISTRQQLTSDDADGAGEDVYANGQLVTRSDGTGPDTDASPASMSRFGAAGRLDDQHAYFTTAASLDPDDADGGGEDVYVRDLFGGDTTLVSRPDAPGPDAAPFDAKFEGVDYLGKRVVFSTGEPMTAGDEDGTGVDGFVRTAEHTGLVTTGPTDPRAGDAEVEGVTGEATGVLFRTAARMTSADRDSDRADTYLREYNRTTLVTGPSGVPDPDAADVGPGILRGHRFVLFSTTERLAPNDRDGGQSDLYEHVGGRTTLVSAADGVRDPLAHDDLSLANAVPTAEHHRWSVFFTTRKRLTRDDRDSARRDVYVHSDGGTALISNSSGVPQPDTGDASIAPPSKAFFGADPGQFYYASPERLARADRDGGAADLYLANLRPSFIVARVVPGQFRRGENAAIRVRLTEPASVTVAFRRQGKGRVLGRIRVRGHLFRDSYPFDGTLANGRRLGPGRYTARFVAIDMDRAVSAPVQRNFRILSPARDAK